ncbi:2-oxoacid dehydrogenases acyltransferase (catalytic domain) [Shewanella psychrophila]|uniref:2-oxoacid dehydrogenases acyltransferase (Catalytic domain) n=1 Tax=Shewanella psychrophila TaxID=225848 RepID=A0A1S6HIT7_9GAMM|nr:2-oxo acid dehydrogenase subunit E2 [Shewanella psychrophila]AQS35436.1 2-oxoacid dehydrogenases acyltransferase (catalytic domain) [Shewanella psychrophila]
MNNTAFPLSRRHTLYFLEQSTQYSPVFLSTDIDATAMNTLRATAKGQEQAEVPGIVAMVMYATGRALANHPDANGVVTGRWRPKLHRFPAVHGKFALDKEIDGVRCVGSGLIAHAETKSLAQIQSEVRFLKQTPLALWPEFPRLKKLQSLPVPLGRWLFGKLMSKPTLKHKLQGSFAITSLGQKPVSLLIPQVGASITLGLGQIQAKALVVKGEVVIRDMLPLTLAFDHRVIDGAEAADLLEELKLGLESIKADT